MIDYLDNPYALKSLLAVYDEACLARRMDPQSQPAISQIWKPLKVMYRAGVRDPGMLYALTMSRNTRPARVRR
ncbi:hypothetical protein [Aminobacter sp. MET-1]|uniref:hypothetical protein n=1 Tax=Aminobacter sp. MET-1 TaxID=2951085 RepID=UPI00226A6CC1|nr:hypothetical protein [Aminobacter sp. MET-1]MCX8570791.1 hypothetical protein [Aminobacter sp. MET-1]